MIGRVAAGLLAPMSSLDASLEVLLVGLSTTAHLPFVLYRKNKTAALPSQLYHDAQATIHTCFYLALKQQLQPNQQPPSQQHVQHPLYLFQQGTDCGELQFVDARTIRHNMNFDVLEVATSSSIDNVFATTCHVRSI